MVQDQATPIGLTISHDDATYLTEVLLSTPPFPVEGRSVIWWHPVSQQLVFSSSRFRDDDTGYVAVVSFYDTGESYNVLASVTIDVARPRLIYADILRTIEKTLAGRP